MEVKKEFMNRPQIAGSVDKYNKYLKNSEINHINKVYHKNNRKESNKDIFEMKLGEILNNTSNFFNEFPNEYQNIIYDTTLNIKEDNSFLGNLKIYIIAFVRYINESENILYLGIILIIISFILYFLNITRVNKNE